MRVQIQMIRVVLGCFGVRFEGGDNLFQYQSGVQDLLDKLKYHHFVRRGSGFQKHNGRISFARQDVYGSVDDKKSTAW